MGITGYIAAFLLSVIFILGLYDWYLSSSLKSYKNYAVAMQAQIASLKAQSDAEKQRFAEAQKEATQQMQQVEQNVQQILKENVSHNCDQAVKWGIDEAQKF